MSVHTILVFLHIVGALGLFAGIGLEWAGIVNLRRASTAGQVREWVTLLKGLRFVEAPAGLAILATGLYMGATVWGHQAWIALGLLGMVMIAALGIVLTRRRVALIAAAVPSVDGPIPLHLRQRIDDPALRLSSRLRIAIALGIVFIMTAKPAAIGAVAAMGIAAILGLAAGLPVRQRGRRSPHPG